MNAARRERNLAPLDEDPVLSEVARAHSRDMMRRRYFDHTSPDGSTAADRVLARGVKYGSVGENVHRSQGMDDPVATAVDAWLTSRGHRHLRYYRRRPPPLVERDQAKHRLRLITGWHA